MEVAIQKLAIVSFLVIGLSHIFQSRAWAQFFIELRSKGEVGSFINGFIHLALGALVVALHNVWDGIPTILALMGYAWVLKSLFYFVAPSLGFKVLSRVSVEKSQGFIVAGILMLGVGGLLLFSLVSRS